MASVAIIQPEEKHFTFDKIPDLTGKKGQAAVELIKSETGNQDVEFLHLNLTSQPSRIVNVSSRGHHRVIGIEFEKLNDPNAQEPLQRYSQSKLANVLFTDELNRQYLKGEQVYANSLHPGVIYTNLLKRDDFSAPKNFLSSAISSEDGTITTLYCATSPEIEEKNYRGRYFIPFGIEGDKSSYAEDEDLAKRLWEFTENLINEKLSQK
ncbi:36068_t:CDS:2 [Gigaspora margarita]|uniref:36068_t:CDS:1 n=1 Tax=Gigaspora margarita TaxID=4874 RepID=A0ABN7W2U7_GIGMA|nr:36068_t:CDS:2 [Gigaspora margarita]